MSQKEVAKQREAREAQRRRADTLQAALAAGGEMQAQAQVAEVCSTLSTCTCACAHLRTHLPAHQRRIVPLQAELTAAHELAGQAQARYTREKEAAEGEWKRAEAHEAEL